MPVKDFRWLEPSEKRQVQLNLMNMSDKQRKGYILEVDLEYPEELHASHNSFPLAPEQLQINETMLSPYAKGEERTSGFVECLNIHLNFVSECYRVINGKTKYTAKKLCTTFNKREKYVVHYMNLKTYVELGMKLRKIHRVLEFTQSLFLKRYIDHATELRTNAGSDFEKSLFKLMINSNFGKFIERTRDYLNVRLCKSEEVCTKLIGSPRFSNMKLISENLVAIFLKQATVVLNKAFPIGFTILDRSKDFMYQQFYQVIRPKLENYDVQVLFSDTDSFGLAIKPHNVGQKDDVLEHLRDVFDFSNYPPNSAKFSKKNASKLGFWKDELQGGRMKEFVGLRSKTYAFLLKEDEKETVLKSKCKGVTKGYKKTINFDQFKKCIDTFSKTVLKQYHIRSSNHIVKTLQVEKTCFSSFDDKRYLMPCGIHSVAYGSKFIQAAEETKKCVFCYY
jgi:hypothetical protein